MIQSIYAVHADGSVKVAVFSTAEQKLMTQTAEETIVLMQRKGYISIVVTESE